MNKIHFRATFALAILAFLTVVGGLNAATKSLTLAWDESAEAQVAGYRVYYGNTSGSYSKSVDAGSDTTAVLNALEAGQTYYFVVTAYFENGVESVPSEEISHLIPAAPSFQITTLPLSQVARPGTAITLNVGTSGTQPLTYQWYKDGNAINGATQASYSIPAIDSSKIGAYSVTVRDSGASLSTPPALVSTVLMKFPKSIEIAGVNGASFEISSVDQLAGSNWSLMTNLTITSNKVNWQDSSASNVQQRFYRVAPTK